jgi:ABC-type uncharacterized transport system fused permease/ATPase subunit
MKDLGAAKKKKKLGMEIHRDQKAKKLFLSQKSYIEKGLDHCRHRILYPLQLESPVPMMKILISINMIKKPIFESPMNQKAQIVKFWPK